MPDQPTDECLPAYLVCLRVGCWQASETQCPHCGEFFCLAHLAPERHRCDQVQIITAQLGQMAQAIFDPDLAAQQSMSLPPGRTCADCKRFRRCKWLIDCEATNTTCDWAPSRFVEREATLC
jgi:hypothetical protein